MSTQLKQIIEHTPLELPHSLPSLKEWTQEYNVFLQNTLGNAYAGIPIAIPHSDISTPHILAIFEYLRKQTTEIIVQLPDKTGFVLLHSVTPEDNYTRKESVHVYPELFSKIDEVPEKKKPEINIDLPTQASAQDVDVLDIIFSLKQNITFTNHLILEGEAGMVTTLCAYVLWLPVAERISYKHNGSIFEIV